MSVTVRRNTAQNDHFTRLGDIGIGDAGHEGADPVLARVVCGRIVEVDDSVRGEVGVERDAQKALLATRLDRYRREGRMNSIGDLSAAVIEGTVDRVRPKLMTVATTLIGLLPIMFGSETGTRVMKRIAAPMVGGLVSSTILTLVVLPAIYYLWKKRSLGTGRGVS